MRFALKDLVMSKKVLNYKLSATWTAPYIPLLESQGFYEERLAECIDAQKGLLSHLEGVDLSALDGDSTLHSVSMVQSTLKMYRTSLEGHIRRCDWHPPKSAKNVKVFTAPMSHERSLSKRDR